MGFKGTDQIKPQTVRRSFNDYFKPSTELETLKALRVACAGRAKTGKTFLGLTAPAPRFIIDTEGSVAVNKMVFSQEEQEQTMVAEVIRYADKKQKKIDLAMSLDALYDATDALTDFLQSADEEQRRGTIIIDSASDVWNWMNVWLEEVAHRTSAGNISRLEWGKANKRYTELMYMCLKSGMNVYMTFRMKELVTNKGETISGMWTPVWQKNTDYWFDVICRVEMVRPDANELTFIGDRLGRLTGTIENPTWDKLIEHIKNNAGVKILG